MKELLIFTGVIVLGMALRSTKIKWLRKLGVCCYIFATGLGGYFLFDSVVVGAIFAIAWFFFPWLELLLSVRRTRLPLENKLKRQEFPCDNYFPEAIMMKSHLREQGYDHITDCGWKWAKSHEHYSFYWHSEKKQLAAICHRVQSCVTFCYLSISSRTKEGKTWQSTNFPFSAALPPSPSTEFNHITEGNISCPAHVIYAHELFLYNRGVDEEDLNETDSFDVETLIELEMRRQIDHNLQVGLIQLTGDGCFRYTYRGLFYLWCQILKDMFRLC